MNRKNFILSLGAAVLCGAAAFLLLYQKAAEVEARSTPVSILVAARYIPAGSFLKNGMAELKSVPGAFVSPSAIRDLQEVAGLTTLAPISAGEQILSNKFGEGRVTLALTLNPGFRAYTLDVSETTGVGGLLRPGNRVDLLTKVASGKREVTSFVYQDVLVLAVGRKLGSPSTGVSENQAEDEGNYGTVTLAVTPEQAETLMFLQGQPLRLILRAPNDDDVVSIAPQSESDVLSKLGRFTKSGRGIEVIRGDAP